MAHQNHRLSLMAAQNLFPKSLSLFSQGQHREMCPTGQRHAEFVGLVFPLVIGFRKLSLHVTHGHPFPKGQIHLSQQFVGGQGRHGLQLLTDGFGRLARTLKGAAIEGIDRQTLQGDRHLGSLVTPQVSQHRLIAAPLNDPAGVEVTLSVADEDNARSQGAVS